MASPPAPDFVALIPARLASTRLPEKALADIGGRPMVVRVAERALDSGAREVAVATDSERIADAVRAHGHRVLMTRSDHPSGTDRLAEAVQAMGLDDDALVVNVQGDEPLIPPALIADVARALAADPGAAVATAAHPIHAREDWQSANVVKVVTDARGRALYFSRAPIPFERDQAGSAHAPGSPGLGSLPAWGLPLRHIGLYAYRTSFLRAYPTLARSPLETIESLEQLRALWHGYPIAVHVMAGAPTAGVDTPADLARVRAAWQAGAARR